jgi:hypothetical protein
MIARLDAVMPSAQECVYIILTQGWGTIRKSRKATSTNVDVDPNRKVIDKDGTHYIAAGKHPRPRARRYTHNGGCYGPPTLDSRFQDGHSANPEPDGKE